MYTAISLMLSFAGTLLPDKGRAQARNGRLAGLALVQIICHSRNGHWAALLGGQYSSARNEGTEWMAQWTDCPSH
mgnify:CR=1 FL=1